MQQERVRFAPSPTGYLHIGGARTALFNWLWARKTGGVFVLRVEDTDRERSTDESFRVILEAMNWLGLNWDEGPTIGGAFGPYTQMERLELYKHYANQLIEHGKAYRCTCTKEELDAARAELKARNPKANFRYPGTCRERNHPANVPHVVRFKTPHEGSITYNDLVFGSITTPNSAQQDFVLMRSDGIPLYNFGAVVDDIAMKITLVARGRDHMVNTPPQILIYQALGAELPKFAHLPMMLDPSGKKLSKRDGVQKGEKIIPVAVGDYQRLGYSPVGLLNYLVRFGWSHGDDEVFSMNEMIHKFDWSGCHPSDGKFDEKKLAAINHEHLKQEKLTNSDLYLKSVMPFLKARGLTSIDSHLLCKTIPLVRERARTYVEAADALDFFFREPPQYDEQAVAKFLKPEVASLLEDLAKVLESLQSWDVTEIHHTIEQLLTEKKLQLKELAQPARVSLTGRSASPGLHETIEALGKQRSIERLRIGAQKARAESQ